MKRRTFLVTLGTTSLAGCAGGESGTQTEDSTATPELTPDITVGSDELVDEDATYKLSARFNARAQQSANPDSMNGGHTSSEGEKIVVVRMEVKNAGDTEIDLVGAIFALSVQERDENVPFNLSIGEPQIGNILLQPGESENGWLLASVPDEVTDGTLIAERNQYYRANYNSSLQVLFEKDESMEIGMDTL